MCEVCKPCDHLLSRSPPAYPVRKPSHFFELFGRQVGQRDLSGCRISLELIDDLAQQIRQGYPKSIGQLVESTAGWILPPVLDLAQISQR